MTAATDLSVKPFVLGVKFGGDQDQHLHLPNGSVARPGPNHDAQPGMNIDDGVVQLHLGVRLALKKVIDFGQSSVVVQSSVTFDLGHMYGTGKVIDRREGAACLAARTLAWGNLTEINDFVGG